MPTCFPWSSPCKDSSDGMSAWYCSPILDDRRPVVDGVNPSEDDKTRIKIDDPGLRVVVFCKSGYLYRGAHVLCALKRERQKISRVRMFIVCDQIRCRRTSFILADWFQCFISLCNIHTPNTFISINCPHLAMPPRAQRDMLGPATLFSFLYSLFLLNPRHLDLLLRLFPLYFLRQSYLRCILKQLNKQRWVVFSVGHFCLNLPKLHWLMGLRHTLCMMMFFKKKKKKGRREDESNISFQRRTRVRSKKNINHHRPQEPPRRRRVYLYKMPQTWYVRGHKKKNVSRFGVLKI